MRKFFLLLPYLAFAPLVWSQFTNVSTNAVYEKTIYSWDYSTTGFPTSLWGRVTNDFTDVGFAGVSEGVETLWGTTNYATWGWIKTNLMDDLDIFSDVVFISTTNDTFFVHMPEFITSDVITTNITPNPPPDGPLIP